MCTKVQGAVVVFLTLTWVWKSHLVPLSTTHSEMKIAEFANSIDLDEVAHNEPPHLDLHCLPS